MELSYLLLIIVSAALGFGTQAYIKHAYGKWSKVFPSSRAAASQVARDFLDGEGLRNVGIVGNGQGDLSDFYDPRDNTLHLSDSSMRGNSIADIAVACHEAGHAVQHARDYWPVKVRTAIVPVVNFGSNAWMIILVAGIAMQAMALVDLAIILFGLVVIFQLVTLPVEFDASKRAMAHIDGLIYLDESQKRGARAVLTAAALTYVAAALTSILQLVYLLQQRED